MEYEPRLGLAYISLAPSTTDPLGNTNFLVIFYSGANVPYEIGRKTYYLHDRETGRLSEIPADEAKELALIEIQHRATRCLPSPTSQP